MMMETKPAESEKQQRLTNQLQANLELLREQYESCSSDRKEYSIKCSDLAQLAEQQQELVAQKNLTINLLKASHHEDTEFSNAVCALFNSTLTNEQSIANCCMGMSGEVGEIVDLLKKVLFHGHPFDEASKRKVMTEVGDVLFYIEALSNTLQFELSECKRLTREKLLDRYPGGKFSSERSVNRMKQAQDFVDS